MYCLQWIRNVLKWHLKVIPLLHILLLPLTVVFLTTCQLRMRGHELFIHLLISNIYVKIQNLQQIIKIIGIRKTWREKLKDLKIHIY